MDTNFIDDLIKNRVENTVNFWGIVEDNADPLNLGRVKVRCYHYHTDDTTEIPTDTLPWAVVLQPTNSSSVSGIGDFSVLQNGSMVYGFFMDGRDAQYPVVTHSVPTIHRPEAPGTPGGTSSGFRNTEDYHSGDSTESNQSWIYQNQGISSDGVVDYTNPATQGDGALTAVGDINMILQPKDGPKFPSMGLPTYSADQAPEGYACKDGLKSLRFHYGTALAFEKLTKEWGKGKLYINSAYRTPAYNRKVGGAKSSMHMAGRAIDVNLSKIGTSQSDLAAFGKAAVKCGFVGFGIYYSQNFIHIDTGTGRVWNGATASWFVDAIKSAGWSRGKKGLSGISTNTGSTSNTNSTDTSGNSTGTGNVKTTGESQEYIYDKMKAAGYSDAQIAGAMGHLQQESGFDPFSYNANDKGMPAYGIAQWRGDRLAALQTFTGQQRPGLEGQVDFMLHELNTSEKAAGNNLRGATSPSEAALAFSGYERFSGYDNPGSYQNQLRARNAANLFTGNSPPSSTIVGFNDPTNSIPTPEYRGEPSTHMSARGFNSYSNQKRILERDNGRLTGFPAAGDVGTFGEPELQAAPQYPFNNVKSSRSGHVFEQDDTPGSERVNLEHENGTSIEMFADGSMVQRTKGNKFNMTNGDEYTGILGKKFLTSVNDMHIRSTADMTQQADGSMNIYIGNDGNLVISGDYLLSVGEDFKVQAKKIVLEAAESIDILSHKSVNIEGREGVTIKAGKSVDIQGGSGIGFKAPLVVSDDIMRVGENKAKEVIGADSADLGAPPPRKIIEKDNLKDTANHQGTVTTEEAFSHYSGGEV